MRRIPWIYLVLVAGLMGGCALEEPKCNGHVLEDGSCEKNDVENCGHHGNSCNVDHAQDIDCISENNQGWLCVFKCDDDYHEYNGRCEKNDENNCGEPNQSCYVNHASYQCRKNDVGQWGCEFECDRGYHKYKDGNEELCEKDDIDNCGEHNVKCNVANAENRCVEKECQFDCDDGYHKHSNGMECELNVIDHCGGHDKVCSTDVKNAIAICNNNGECDFKCEDGFHKFNDSCEKDSETNCGEHGNNCQVEDAIYKCESGACVIICNIGSYKDGNECKPNNVYNCGELGNQCPAVDHASIDCENAKCVFECRQGYHKRYTGDAKCSGDECKYKSNYCEEDSVNNCGSHENTCITRMENAHSICENANCGFECDEGFWYNGLSNECDRKKKRR